MFSTLCASPVVWRQKVPGSIQTCVVVCMMTRPCIVAEKLIWWGCNKALINLWPPDRLLPPDGLLQNQCSLQYTLYRWEMNVPLKKTKKNWWEMIVMLTHGRLEPNTWSSIGPARPLHHAVIENQKCTLANDVLHHQRNPFSQPCSLVTRLPRSLLHARRLWQCVARSSYGCLGYVVATQPFGIAKIIWGWANTPICFFLLNKHNHESRVDVLKVITQSSGWAGGGPLAYSFCNIDSSRNTLALFGRLFFWLISRL
jgi:hypothetical protein